MYRPAYPFNLIVAAVCLVAFMVIPSQGQLVTEVEVQAGPSVGKFDVLHKNYVPPPEVSPGWVFIPLPANMQPVQVSRNGTVLLADSNYFYRWQKGAIETLHAAHAAGSTWVNPMNGRTYGSAQPVTAINAAGEIALNFRFHVRWSLPGSRDNYYDSVHRLKKWVPGTITSSEYDGPFFSFTTVPFNRAYVDHITHNLASLKALDDTGTQWVQIGDRVVTLYDYWGILDQRVLNKVVRISSSGAIAETPFKQDYATSTYQLNGVSASGVAIGWVRNAGVTKYYVGDKEVNFQPLYINRNGWLLGAPSGAKAFLEEPDGTRSSWPIDGYVKWIDDQNRLNGEYYPPEGGGPRKIVWIRNEGTPVTYERKDYLRMQPPPPWSTNHEFAPGSTSIQLGLMTRPTDAGTETRPFLAVPCSIAVDANRDGEVKLASEDASDATSSNKPYRFWINDDIDRGHTVDGDDYEQDDISPTEAAANSWVEDWKSNTVQSRRDLEDFARIVVSTSGLSDAFRNGDLYLGLKWADTVGTPAIKLYKQYDATGGTSYLTDDYQASVQLAEKAILNQRYPSDDVASPSAHTVVTPGDVFVLPQALWFGLSGDTLKRSLLFEGCTAGTGQLKLVILKCENGNYTEIGDGPGAWINLKNIKEMYEHWTVGQGPVPYGGGAPGALSQASSFTYTAQSPEESKYILFVHGWNMEKWEKERFAETAYKRLYWQGYKGRFGLFSWPTTNGFNGIRSAITDSTNYDRGEFSAWRSASLLEQKLVQLNGQYPSQVYLLAHSMGNVVAGEALRLAGQEGLGVIVRTYVASQSALPVHCYNGSLSDNLDADVPASGLVRVFDGGWPQTANAYKSWLTANSAAVAKRVNFFNINDYALWRDIWQLNQWLKPDHPDLRANPPDPQRTYAYLDDISQPPTQNGFGWLRRGGQVDPSDRPSPYVSGWWYAVLRLGNAVDVKDRYEIMAMASESRSKALGATSFNEGLDASLWLGSIWPADSSGDARPYSRHKWHSAQFRSSNMLQKGYWQALLGPQGFNIVTPP